MFQTRPRRFVKTARMLKRVLNEIVPISQLCFVIGDFIHLLQNQVPFLIIYLLLFLAESGAGKSTLLNKILKQTNPSNVFLFWIFLLFFYEKIFFQVFIQSKDQQDFSSLDNISFLEPDFTITTDNFSNLKSNYIVIFDDFSLNHRNKQNKIDFLNVINYTLRHNNITLFLIIHNLYNVGLMNEILLAPHIILAYSNLGYYIMRQISNIPNIFACNNFLFVFQKTSTQVRWTRNS